MLAENSHAQIRPCNVTLRRRVLPYPVDRTKRYEVATPLLDLRAQKHAYLRGDATLAIVSCTCPEQHHGAPGRGGY
jgi:hypothetical protein